MTRRQTPVNDLSTLDQVAAALRDADRAVTVRELSDRGAGAFIWFLARRPGQLGPGDPLHEYWAADDAFHECHDEGCIKSSRGGVQQSSLEHLARRGLAERTKVGRRVFWSWTGPAVDMSAFEEQMSL